MKKRLLLAFLLLAAASALEARTNEPYYCTSPGTTLYYERHSVGKHKLLQTTTIEIESVDNTQNGRQVNYALTMRNGNGTPMYGGRTPLTVMIGKKSEVLLDLGATARDLLKNLTKLSNITSQGDCALMPANMAPGDTLPDAHSIVTVAGIKYNIDVTNRTVLRKDRIDTPCGTFDCVVLREYKAETGPGHNHVEWSENWYVRGYGYVRHDVFDKNGKLKASETLISRVDR